MKWKKCNKNKVREIYQQIIYNELHKFYIDIDAKVILKQICLRLLIDEIPNDKNAIEDFIINDLLNLH